MAAKRKLPVLELSNWPMEDRRLFEQAKRKARWSDNTRHGYQTAIGRWLYHSSSTRTVRGCLVGFERCEEKDFRAYQSWLRSSLTEKTVLSALKQLLAIANQMGLNTKNLSAFIAEWRVSDPGLFGVPAVKAQDRRFKAPETKVIAPPELWPDILRNRWCKVRDEDLAGDGLFAEATWKNRETAIGRFVGWHTARGTVFDINPDVLKAYIADMQLKGLSPVTIKSYVEGLYEGLSQLYPKAHLVHMLRLVGADRLGHEPKRINNVEADYLEVCRLGLELNREAQEVIPLLNKGLMLRDAAIISLLCVVPMRVSDLASLKISNFPGMVLDDGLDQPSSLCFAFNQHKTKAEFASHHLPDSVNQVLWDYLMVGRPLLRRNHQTERLWLSKAGKPFAAGGITSMLKRRSKVAFDVAVNPHRYRSLVADFMLFNDPDSAEHASTILGHTSPRSRAAYVERGASIGAINRLTKAIDELRAT